MKIKIYQVDAFTDKPFAGNPAAVCVTDTALEEDLMQSIALEMNLSETAFATPVGGAVEKTKQFNLRWFTPTCEVNLCGHATLATGKVLFHAYQNPNQQIHFETKSGELKVLQKSSQLCLDFPLDISQPTTIPDELPQALGTDVIECVKGKTTRKLIAQVTSVQALKSLQPNFKALVDIEKSFNNAGVIVTAKDNTEDYDFISRYFAPGIGIDEDPVTGSAHTVLAHYWGEKLQKSSMKAYQASARGGAVTLEIHGDRVYLYGNAVIVMEGTLIL